jgi:hypothetical protein
MLLSDRCPSARACDWLAVSISTVRRPGCMIACLCSPRVTIDRSQAPCEHCMNPLHVEVNFRDLDTHSCREYALIRVQDAIL